MQKLLIDYLMPYVIEYYLPYKKLYSYKMINKIQTEEFQFIELSSQPDGSARYIIYAGRILLMEKSNSPENAGGINIYNNIKESIIYDKEQREHFNLIEEYNI